MHIFVELWNVRQAWLDLPQADRVAYVEGVGGAMGELAEAGIECICWSHVDDADYPSGHKFMAVWKMPDQSAVELFEKTVEGAGWYNYFEQVNARGALQTPQEVLGDLIGL